MHRTTTTATLLVTVAVSALSGCVTVQRPAGSGPPTAPAQSSAPRSDGPAQPQIVQAPAREALQLVGPSRRPESTAAAPRRPAAAEPATPRPQGTQTRSPSPERRPAHQHRVDIQDMAGELGQEAPGNTHVCDLGQTYGGWRADSPEAVICRQTYGR